MSIQITPENSRQYVGRNIVFTTNNQSMIKKITGVSDSGKTIYIDYPELNNSLQLVTRKVFLHEPQTLRQQEDILRVLENLELGHNITFNKECSTCRIKMQSKVS
jgi:hypothetical protein